MIYFCINSYEKLLMILSTNESRMMLQNSDKNQNQVSKVPMNFEFWACRMSKIHIDSYGHSNMNMFIEMARYAMTGFSNEIMIPG